MKLKFALLKFLKCFLIASALYGISMILILLWVNSKLKGEIKSLKENGFEVNYSYFWVNIFSRSISIYDLTVKETKEKEILTQIKIVKLYNISSSKEKGLEITDIELYRPNINFALWQKVLKANRFSLSKPSLKKLNVNRLMISDIEIIPSIFSSKKNNKLSISSIEMDHINLEEIKLKGKNWRPQLFIANGISYINTEKLLKIQCSSILYEHSKSSISSSKINIVPLLSEQDYGKHFKKQIGRIGGDVSFDIQNVDIDFEQKQMKGSSLNLDFNMKVYVDKNFPFTKIDTTKLPNEYLNQLPFKFSFDSLKILNSTFSYKELLAKNSFPALIDFNQINLFCYNFQNKIIDSTLHFQLHSQIMDQGDFEIQFTLPLNKHQYACSGIVKNLPLNRLNSLLESSLAINANRGEISNLKFNFTYDNLMSRGTVGLVLNKVWFVALKQNNLSKKSLIKSVIINRILNKKIKKAKTLYGSIEFKRDKRKFILNYWWKSVLSGIKSSIGIYDLLPPDNIIKQGK